MHYILFYPDEMRAKSLSCYGNPIACTPNFDRLTSEGTIFNNNYTQHPVCVASRCSLMTGWYPHVQGFRTLRHFMQPHHPNFLRYVKQAGYQIHLYGKNHVFSSEVYNELIDYDLGQESKYDWPAVRSKCDDYTMMFDPMPDDFVNKLKDTVCVQKALEAIHNYKDGDKPLFIFLPLFYPHPPYHITRYYQEMYDYQDTPVIPPDASKDKPALYNTIRDYRNLKNYDAQVFAKIHAAYLGMCTYVDMLLGKILDALDETGMNDNTTVIASSDHGDWAGDYGLVEKWPNAFDDDLTRVPLIIRSPGQRQNQKVDTPTATFDIFPTILDLQGIPVNHDHFGNSLKPQLAGEPGNPQRCVYCEGGYDMREPNAFEGTKNYQAFMHEDNIYYPKMMQQLNNPESCSRGVMMRDNRYKLCIRTNGENELYDMLSDPYELNNLFYNHENQSLALQLQSKMLQWMIHTSDVVPWENHI